MIKEKNSKNLFVKYKLSGMLAKCFNNSPYEAINHAYPDKFKEWEFNMVPNKYWNEENSKKAVIWLIEERLNLSDEKLKQQLSCKLFMDNRLNGMLKHYFNGSPYNAINHAYPNKFKKDDFKGYC